MGGIIMERNELEALIRFAKSNGIMNWSFEEVLNEYKTTKMHHEEPRFDPKTLQPFDKVLVRTELKGVWNIDLFGYKKGPFAVCLDTAINDCIPFNNETEHLLGTNDDCPEYYKWWEE